MKNLLSLMFVAAAAMTFTACSDADDIMPNESNNGKALTIIAENPAVDNNTRTELGYDTEGNIVPLWSKGDIVYLLNRQNDINISHSFEEIAKSNPKTDEASLIASFTFPEAEMTKFKAGDKFSIIHRSPYKEVSATYEGDKFYYETPSNVKPNNANDFSEGDVLISEDGLTIPEDLSTPLKVRFKRVTGVVRMIIADGTGGMLNNDAIASVTIKHNVFLRLAGTSEVSMTDGTVATTPEQDLNVNLANFDYYADNMEGFHFSVSPIDLKEETDIVFVVRTKSGKMYEKTVNANALSIPAGKRTTIKLTLKAENEVDTESPLYVPGSGEITLQSIGLLNTDMLKEAVGNGSMIKINGNLGNKDYKVIRDFLTNNSKSFTLDLNNANLKADNDQFASFCRIKEDNALPKYFLEAEQNVWKVIMPNSLVKIDGHAIGSNSKKFELVIGPNIKYIGSRAVSAQKDATELCNIWVLFDPNNVTIEPGEAFSIYENGKKSSLYIKPSWIYDNKILEAHFTNYQYGNDNILLWHGMFCYNIYIIDENMKVIKQVF